METTDGIIYGEIASGIVTINGKPLNLENSLKVRNHSSTGFAWGYPGSGFAQLTLVILLEFVATNKALEVYQEFNFDVLLNFDSEKDFSLPVATVKKWFAENCGSSTAH